MIEQWTGAAALIMPEPAQQKGREIRILQLDAGNARISIRSSFDFARVLLGQTEGSSNSCAGAFPGTSNKMCSIFFLNIFTKQLLFLKNKNFVYQLILEREREGEREKR